MKQLLSATALILALLLAGCQTDQAEDRTRDGFTEVDGQGDITNADIIRNPVSANQPQDTVNVARMAFAELTFDFGSVDAGGVVTHSFNFTNTGRIPLIISDVRSTCGCTASEWPREPVPPGAASTIAVRFDSKGKSGQQSKPIVITANTYPATTELRLIGQVNGDGSAEESL